jgi:multiple sugar transport system permease protein
MSEAAGISSERENRTLAYMALLPSAIVLAVIVAIPAATVVTYSLQRVDMAGAAGRFVGLSNYLWIFTSRDFYATLWNTLIWVFGCVALEMVLGLALAVLLNRNFLGRGLARAIVFAPYLIPTVVAVLVWRYMFHDVVGILNFMLMKVGLISGPLNWIDNPRMAMASVIIVGVWKFTPFVVLAILGVLQSIPQEQYEAAKIDGASDWQAFWRITIPHVMPIFLLTALLRTIWTFHQFDVIYLLTGGGPINATRTLPLLVYQSAFTDFNFGRAAALALVTAVILIVICGIYFVLNKRAESWR